MATRQYIGARYVPVFYTNSDGTAEWRGGVIYEPLTIVTYNNNTYTSKTSVPSHIGDPSANPQYWVATGNFNAQLSQLSGDVEEIKRTTVKTYSTIGEMVEDFGPDDSVCLVINAKFLLGGAEYDAGGPAYYIYSPESRFDEYTVEAGGSAVMASMGFKPIAGSVAPVDAIPGVIRTGYTYTGVTKPGGFVLDTGVTVYNVQYQSSAGPYAGSAAGHRGIQCSQFVRSALSGLDYEASKLADEANINLDSDANYPFRDGSGQALDLAASEMAHYAFAHGWYKATQKLEDIQVGDIAFFRGESSTAGRWEGIGHCALCVGRLNSAIMFMQAGSIPSVEGFNRTPVRPGFEDDAVNFIGISPVDVPFASEDYRLMGFARIPYNSGAIGKCHEYVSNAPVQRSYEAGAANSNFTLLNESASVSALFGLLRFCGYTGRKNSHSALNIFRNTVESGFPATGTEFSTVSHPVCEGVFPILFNSDGASKVVSCGIGIRTTQTTIADDFKIDQGISIEFYK